MLLLKNDFLCTFSNTIHKLLFDVYFSLVSSIPHPQFLSFLLPGGAFPPIPSIPHPQFLMFSLFSFHPLCYSSIIESNDTDTLTCLMSICYVVVN